MSSTWHHPYAFYLTLPIFGLPNTQECDHVSSPFWFDKQSHLTRIINLWHQNQLSQVSLNSWSTCFGRKFIACHSNPSSNVHVSCTLFLRLFVFPQELASGKPDSEKVKMLTEKINALLEQVREYKIFNIHVQQ